MEVSGREFAAAMRCAWWVVVALGHSETSAQSLRSANISVDLERMGEL
jgi:hypothetical protein